MPSVWTPLILAPVAAVVLVAFAVRPRAAAVAPYRLALTRAAVIVGAFAVLVVEVASAARAVRPAVIALAWVGALAAAGCAALRRGRSDRRRGGPPRSVAVGSGVRARLVGLWRAATRGERVAAIGAVLVVFAELVVSVLAEPNNYDSQTYHLPRVERWVQQQGVEFFPTAIHRQVSLAPGSEFLLLHLRLLGGDFGGYGSFGYPLVQWLAGIGCAVVASRIAAQLGGGRRAQLLTAFLVLTTPMVVMQASSTQTDLVAAAWVACVATFALDGWRRRATPFEVVLLGAATGLAAVTKGTGLLGAGPMLVLWGIGQLRPHRSRHRAVPSWPRRIGVTGVATVAILAVAAMLVSPFLSRMAATYGNPVSSPQIESSIPMQRHDPAAVVVNGLRIAVTALDTPVPQLRQAAAAAVTGLGGAIGASVSDPAITFPGESFPAPAWYPDEDLVSLPLQGGLALLAIIACLVRPRRVLDGAEAGALSLLRSYCVAVMAAAVLFAATVKWQPWVNRLLLFVVVLALPVVGLWLDAMLVRLAAPAGAGAPDARRRLARVAVAGALSLCAAAAVLTVGYGFPRRLVGDGSVFTTHGYDSLFIRRPQWLPDYTWAAQRVREAGARRVGLVERHNDWEYPWWRLLNDPGIGAAPGQAGSSRVEIVPLTSAVPHRPPADPDTVDAIICTGTGPSCAGRVPAGWLVEQQGYVSVALPRASR